MPARKYTTATAFRRALEDRLQTIDRGPVSGFKSFDLSTRGPEFFFDFLVAAIEEMARPASNFLAS